MITALLKEANGMTEGPDTASAVSVAREAVLRQIQAKTDRIGKLGENIRLGFVGSPHSPHFLESTELDGLLQEARDLWMAYKFLGD